MSQEQATTNPSPTSNLPNINAIFERLLSLQTVFGSAVTQGDSLVIPASEAMGGLGVGFGFGLEPAKEKEGASQGGGGGGGGYMAARPVAAIIITPRGVRVEPIVDATKLGLAFVAAVLGVATSLLRARRAGRR